MAGEMCARCGQAVSLMHRDWTSGLCPKCRVEIQQEQDAADLDGLRQLEDRLVRLLLWPTPKPWRPALERVMSHARFRGLTKLVGGLVVAAAMLLITIGLGMLTGQYVASALVGFPLAISMVGLMEIVIGINFADLAKRFDHGGFFLKLGIAIVVLFFAAVYLAGCVFVYRQYFQ
jgi:hypothetical protein